MTMMQNQIGLVEFADLECRASEVLQGACTAMADFAKPRQDIRGIFVKPCHLFWRASSSKTKGPLHLRKHDIVPFK